MAAELIETARLRLRRPRLADADATFRRYASDPEVTRFMSFFVLPNLSPEPIEAVVFVPRF